jgi:hypothetical protein
MEIIKTKGMMKMAKDDNGLCEICHWILKPSYRSMGDKGTMEGQIARMEDNRQFRN